VCNTTSKGRKNPKDFNVDNSGDKPQQAAATSRSRRRRQTAAGSGDKPQQATIMNFLNRKWMSADYIDFRGLIEILLLYRTQRRSNP
jgi:hypothetical protein